MELLLKLTPAITSILFSIGGSGWKFVRRYLLPFFALIIYYSFTTLNLQHVISCILLMIAMHLPYGDSLEKIPWVRYIVFGIFFLPFALVSWTWWILLSWLVTSGLFIASNSKWGEKIVPWWIVEPVIGGLIGITLTSTLC